MYIQITIEEMNVTQGKQARNYVAKDNPGAELATPAQDAKNQKKTPKIAN